jgi:beta-galactosidase
MLNGKRLLLRGTHRHEDHAGVAAAMTEDMIRTEIQMMKDMGVNFIRLGHYQQSRIVLNLCDSLGIMVWEEIPWCRGGLGGPVYQAQAKRMLTNMIEQHYNHPAVIIWGLGNENDWPNDFSTFEESKIRAFMSDLNDLSHKLDKTRMTAIRRCDFCKDIVDVYSPSIWAGWYRGIYTEYKEISKKEFDTVDRFLHVEWGGDSHAGRHSESPDNALSKVKKAGSGDEREGDASLYGGSARVSKDGDWSESYICNLIDWHLKEQETMPWLSGTAYWPFKDFSTPVRPDNPVPYMNQKGVIERDFTKKEAFYVFQSYWTNNLMAHIYGHSWPVRWGDLNEPRMIKVYANADEAELFLNGVSQGVKKRNSQDFPAAGLRWMVNYKEGENNIKVVAKRGKEVVIDEISQLYQTTKWGKPAKLVLQNIADADGKITIEAKLLDANNVLCLDAKYYVEFDLTGDGKLIDNQGTSSGSRKVQLYNGRAVISFFTHGGKSIASVKSDGIPTVFLNL